MGVTKITTPLTTGTVESLKAGDMVEISGIVYTGRDAAHKKMIETLQRGDKLPFDVEDQIIYYVGPCPAKPGQIIGSAGPTTSGRMDAYAPTLIGMGLRGMIGKGIRTPEVIEAMKKYKGVYFGAIGGAGALISKTIKKEEVVAYPELETEAIRKLTVENFPVIVIIDCFGNNLYDTGKNKFCTID